MSLPVAFNYTNFETGKGPYKGIPDKAFLDPEVGDALSWHIAQGFWCTAVQHGYPTGKGGYVIGAKTFPPNKAEKGKARTKMVPFECAPKPEPEQLRKAKDKQRNTMENIVLKEEGTFWQPVDDFSGCSIMGFTPLVYGTIKVGIQTDFKVPKVVKKRNGSVETQKAIVKFTDFEPLTLAVGKRSSEKNGDSYKIFFYKNRDWVTKSFLESLVLKFYQDCDKKLSAKADELGSDEEGSDAERMETDVEYQRESGDEGDAEENDGVVDAPVAKKARTDAAMTAAKVGKDGGAAMTAAKSDTPMKGADKKTTPKPAVSGGSSEAKKKRKVMQDSDSGEEEAVKARKVTPKEDVNIARLTRLVTEQGKLIKRQGRKLEKLTRVLNVFKAVVETTYNLSLIHI